MRRSCAERSIPVEGNSARQIEVKVVEPAIHAQRVLVYGRQRSPRINFRARSLESWKARYAVLADLMIAKSYHRAHGRWLGAVSVSEAGANLETLSIPSFAQKRANDTSMLTLAWLVAFDDRFIIVLRLHLEQVRCSTSPVHGSSAA